MIKCEYFCHAAENIELSGFQLQLRLVFTVFVVCCRSGGSGSGLGALDLPDDRPVLHAHLLPQPAPRPPEERQALRQHGREKHVHQRPAAGPG